MAVGANYEKGNATGIDGNQTDDSLPYAGAAYVFARNGAVWSQQSSQQAYVKASNTDTNDMFGFSLALSGNGNTLAVGAYREDSNAQGIGGDQADNTAADAGAVYVFVRDGQWSQQTYVKASNTAAGDRFGYNVALSDDASTLAVGAVEEDSSATGISGNQADNSTIEAGAVYLY